MAKEKGIIIREAKMSDVKSLIPLAKELMDHNRSLAKNKTRKEMLKLVPNVLLLWKKWVTKWIKSRNGFVIVAEIDNEIVGYSLNYIKENVKVYQVRKIGYISDLYVQKKYWRKGIGSKFKEKALIWFKKKKMKFVSLAVHAENKKAYEIYEKWGFLEYITELRMEI